MTAEGNFSDVTIVIDASNVCWGRALADHKIESKGTTRPPMRGLVICVNYFEAYRARGSRLIAVTPSWWDHDSHMDTEDQEAFDALKAAEIIQIAPPGVHDDLVILGCALAGGRIVIITNDKFRDHQARFGFEAEWYESRRVGFEFVNDAFFPDLKKLENILGNSSLLGTQKTFSLPEYWDATESATRQHHGVETFQTTFSVDPSLIGLMIGKGGTRIKQIETRFGTSIRIRDGIATITGLSPEHIFWAKIELCSVKPPIARKFKVPHIPESASMELEGVSKSTIRLAKPDILKPISSERINVPGQSNDHLDKQYNYIQSHSDLCKAEQSKIASPDPLGALHATRASQTHNHLNPPSVNAMNNKDYSNLDSIPQLHMSSVRLADPDRLRCSMRTDNTSGNVDPVQLAAPDKLRVPIAQSNAEAAATGMTYNSETQAKDESKLIGNQYTTYAQLAAPDTLGKVYFNSSSSSNVNDISANMSAIHLDRSVGTSETKSDTKRSIELPPIRTASSSIFHSRNRGGQSTPKIASPDLTRYKASKSNSDKPVNT